MFFCLCVCFFLSGTEPTELCNCESLKNIEIKTDAYCLLKTEWIVSNLSAKPQNQTMLNTYMQWQTYIRSLQVAGPEELEMASNLLVTEQYHHEFR